MISRMRLKNFLALLVLALSLLCATTMASGQTSSFVFQHQRQRHGRRHTVSECRQCHDAIQPRRH